ncbi:MAG: AAA family ATPase [Candidatus Zixiibacteriota bacterium]|nr:MAG: AAA family ATPase [candidate division Zixibacteria bacterium]
MNRLKLHDSRTRPGHEARIITLLSGKGGVGKSVLAFNLSERLSALGKRVLLVDADFYCGNIHILCNQTCDFGIGEVARGKLTLEEAVTSVSDKLDILPAVGCDPDLGLHEIDVAGRFMQTLREGSRLYDTIIVDQASGVSTALTAMTYGADVSLIVLIPEFTSISDAYGLYKFLQRSGDGLDCRLLLNRAQDGEEAHYIYQKFCAVSGRFLSKVPELAGVVSEDPVVRKSIASQDSIYSVAGDSVVSQELTELAARIDSERRVGPITGTDSTINNTPARADIRE